MEKYKPQNSQELVGNNTNVATLRQWLHQWGDVHLRGATPVQPKGSYGVRRIGFSGLLSVHTNFLMPKQGDIVWTMLAYLPATPPVSIQYTATSPHMWHADIPVV